MKVKRIYLIITLIITTAMLSGTTAHAQQYKLRQVNSVMNMKTETTIYVKGMRKRTEGGNMMGMGANLVTIEQCDKQRTITINDKKKLYYIAPFANDANDIIDDDVKTSTAVKTKPVAKTSQKGGVINMYYNITDTGERKKIYGLTARHIWTTQKIKPSPDACYMKDSMIIKTDGWYIDLPEFNCPVRYSPSSMNGGYEKPDCKDRYVNHTSGKGKLGFPIEEKRTMIMGDAKTTSYEMTLETLELSTQKLDSMLFEIPPGYTAAKNMDELQEQPDMTAMMQQSSNKYGNNDYKNTQPGETEKEGRLRIGVYEPIGESQTNNAALQQYIVATLKNSSMDAIAIHSEDDAVKYNCDYTLRSDFIQSKQAGKVGGFLKAIKNADPSAGSSFTIELVLTLVRVKDGSTIFQPKVNGKYSGKQDEAARKALDEGCSEIFKKLR